MNPLDNAQEDYYFMSLASGNRVSQHQLIELPITDAVIAAVETMSLVKGQRSIAGGLPLFRWRPNVPLANEICVEPRAISVNNCFADVNGNDCDKDKLAENGNDEVAQSDNEEDDTNAKDNANFDDHHSNAANDATDDHVSVHEDAPADDAQIDTLVMTVEIVEGAKDDEATGGYEEGAVDHDDNNIDVATNFRYNLHTRGDCIYGHCLDH